MSKLPVYIESLKQILQSLDEAFEHANAVEVLRPLQPLSARWQMAPQERDLAERAEAAHYDPAPDHWGARLALISAHESLNAALRIMASSSAHADPGAEAWLEAAGRSREAARLALEAATVFEEVRLTPVTDASGAATAVVAQPAQDHEGRPGAGLSA